MNKELSNEVKKYLERELKDYKYNKKKINELRLDIIEESPKVDLGVPSSPNRGSEGQTNKVHRLMTNTIIRRLEDMCYHIEKVLNELDDNKYEFYTRCFEKRQSKVKICMEMPIAEKTYYRYKDKIVYSLAEELGFI